MRWFPWLFVRRSEAATIAHRVHVALTKAEGAMLSKSEARRALAMRDLHKELEIVARAIGYEAEPMSGGLPKDKDPGEKEEPKPDEVQP